MTKKKKNNKVQWKKNNWDIQYAKIGVEALKALGIGLKGNSESYYIPNGQQGVAIAKRETSKQMQSWLVLYEGIDREQAEIMVPDNCNNFNRIFPGESQKNDKQSLRTCPRLYGTVYSIIR